VPLRTHSAGTADCAHVLRMGWCWGFLFACGRTKKKQKVCSEEEAPQAGFYKIMELEKKRGFIMEFKVGKKTGVTFEKACKDAYPAISKFLTDNKLMDKHPSVLAVSPDDPREKDPARYRPGMFFTDPNIPSGLEKLKVPDKIRLVELPKSKMYIWQHVGSYENLKDSWPAALADLQKRKLKMKLGADDMLCYEQYVDDPEETPEETRRTWICIGVQ